MKIETKFNLNDEVWIMKNNHPYSFRVFDIKTHSSIQDMGNYSGRVVTSIEYKGYSSDTWYSENKLYSSKEELRKSIFGE